jgi:two-component system OmpR family sensor kinase
MTRRLIFRLTALLGIAWLIAAIASAATVSHEFDEIFDEGMKVTAARLLQFAAIDADHLEDLARARNGGEAAENHGESDEGHDGEREEERDGEHDDEHYLVYQVLTGSGQLLFRSPTAENDAFSVPLERGFAEARNHRVYTALAEDGRLIVQVSEPLEMRHEAIFESLSWLLFCLLALLPLAGLLIWWTLRRMAEPIGAAQRELERRGGANLEPLPEGELPEELTPLIRDVNRLLERLSLVLAAERAFASNSAHELRTPLAEALAQGSALLRRLPEGPERERVAGLLASLRALSNLVEKLLQLARAEAGLGLSRESDDLLPVIRMIFEDFRRRHPNRRLRLLSGDLEELESAIDLDAFGIALSNLIENALLHGDEESAVAITVAEGEVAVVNETGAALPEEALSSFTQRFARGATQGPGSGLGLSIVDMILRQAGGELVLFSPKRGAEVGFEAVLRLPAPKPGAAGN